MGIRGVVSGARKVEVLPVVFRDPDRSVVGIAIVAGNGEGAFEGEGPFPSATWLGANLVIGFVAALVAGLAARKVGRSVVAVKILIGLLVGLGILSAIMAETQYAKGEPVGKPVTEMTFRAAGQHAKQPVWYNWAIPLIGVAGAWLGGGLGGGRNRD